MNKIGTLDIIKAYLGNKELSANNAYIGEIPLIKGTEPLDKDYFYLQPSQAVTYNVGTDSGVVSTTKINTFEYSFDQINWTAINDIPHTGGSMSIGDIMTEHPTYAVLALARSAYDQYVIGNGYEIWCYHWDDGNPNSWPGSQANFIGADSTYAFYYLDLGVAQVNIIWNIVEYGQPMSQTSDMMQMTAGQLVVWNGENRRGSKDNSSNYYLENFTWDDIQIAANQKMYLRNTAGLGTLSSNSATKIINAIQNVNYNVGGNIETIYNYTSDNNMTSKFAYYLFFGDTHIINAGSLILPATTLASSCYENMFSGCTSLTTAPALPATSLARSCYYYMFKGCTSLTTAPALPATSLADNCYNQMFYGCTSLTTAPALPATSLASSCYYAMFNGCTSLTTAPALPATTLANNCYYYMFHNCSSLSDVKVNSDTIVYFTGWLDNVSPSGTITINRNAWYTTSSSSVPSGWTIIETGDLYEYELIQPDQIQNSDQIIFVTEYVGTYRIATTANYASSISGDHYGLILSKESINVSNNKFSSSELRNVKTASIDSKTAQPLWLRVYEVSSGIYAFVNKEWIEGASNYLKTYISTKAGNTSMNGSNQNITLPEYNYSIGSGTAPLISNITGSGSYKNLYATITTSGGYITNNSSGNSFMIFRRVSNA